MNDDFFFNEFSFLIKQQVPRLGREISQSHGNPEIYKHYITIKNITKNKGMGGGGGGVGGGR